MAEWRANVGGTAGAKLRREGLRTGMEAYDALPHRLRLALADAPLNFSPVALLGIYRKHGENIALASLENAIRSALGAAERRAAD